MAYKINHANIKDWAKNYDGPLFDGILCDPPYHLVSGKTSEEIGHPSWNSKTKSSRTAKKKGFMGKDWDGVDENGIGIAQDPEMWRLLYNLLKPGAHLLAFSGSRTYHRMAVAIEDAGFEIRDMIEWVYGSGFPKSLNIGLAIDKKNGVIGNRGTAINVSGKGDRKDIKTSVSKANGTLQAGYTDAQNDWNGYGTALKPAHEPCVLARKPLDGTVAGNCLKYGTGGLAIDNCRVRTEDKPVTRYNKKKDEFFSGKKPIPQTPFQNGGRFPANLIHDGSDEVEAVFPQTGKSRAFTAPMADITGGNFKSYKGNTTKQTTRGHNDNGGSASRFFMTCNDTQKHAIMNIWNDIDVSIADNSSTITALIEKVMNITSALGNVPLNIDLVNQSLNALFVGTKSKSTEIDFVAKLVAIKEVPEDMLSQQELKAIQGYMQNSESFIQNQSHVSGAENKGSTDITQTTINLLKLCGYVLHAIDENTKQANQESDSDQAKTTRFLYTAKASKSERNAGLEGFEDRIAGGMQGRADGSLAGPIVYNKNVHPTVKPLSLTKYLATLIKPPTGGRLLVPFSGSGSEMIGALQAGWEYVEGVELTEEYIPIAEARIKHWTSKPNQEKLL